MDATDSHERYLKLLLRSEPDLRAFICSVVIDTHEREDVFQETALTLWRRFEDYNPQLSFGSWARGIATKLILNRRAKSARHPAPLSLEAIEALREAFDRTEDSAADRHAALRECLEKLPPHSREMLSWRYEKHLKGAEIAQRTGSSLDAVHKALSRLRAALEKCVELKLS